MAKTTLVMLLACLVATPSAGAQRRGGDELTQAFGRWFRDFKAGRIEPGDVWGPQSKPYIDRPGPRRDRGARGGAGRGRPSYSRLDEAAELFRRLAERGTARDGQRLLSVIEVSLKRKGGKFWEKTGKFSRFREAAVRAVAHRACPEAVRDVLAARLSEGLPAPRSTAKQDLDAGVEARAGRRHADPELATVLVRIVGSFRRPEHRELLEDCLAAGHSGVRTEAAAALAEIGFGRSIAAVARALSTADYADDVASFARSLGRLIRATRPEPTERDLKFALGLVQQQIVELQDWRGRLALVPVLRQIRSRSSVPVLIDLLERTNRGLGKSGAEGRAASGTLLAAVHDALTDLTGFWADARKPERWREWWSSVEDSFVIVKDRRGVDRRAGGGEKTTVASTFFGIPVTGNRVVFVVDVSGSMAWPFGAITTPGGRGPAGGPGGRRAGGPPPGSYETKLDRSKKELRGAVANLGPDAKLNVVFFSDRVSQWKPKLVRANKKNVNALDGFLTKYRGQGSTALYDGMRTAMDIKLDRRKSQPYRSPVDEIFVLSDGAPTLGQITDKNEILRVVTQWNVGAQVRIHTIYIGGQDGGSGNWRGRGGRAGGTAAFMKRLAEQNNGKFVRPEG